MDRVALLRGLRRERDQQLHCWRIPFAVLTYVIAATSLILHLQVEPSFALERGLVDSIVPESTGAVAVTSAASLFDFLRDELLPEVFPRSVGAGIGGTINSYSQVLGGIRLAQSRSESRPCPVNIPIAAAFSGSTEAVCHPESTASVSPFGNASAAEHYSVASAFIETRLPKGVPRVQAAELDPFVFVLSVRDALGSALALVDGLQEAQWVDAATKRIVVEVSVLNLEVAAWGRLLLTFSFTRGGRVDAVWTARSLPIDPYGSAPILAFFDVLNILYAAYLVIVVAFSTWHRCMRAAREARLPGRGICSALSTVLDTWWLVDVASTVCLILVIAFWGTTVTALTALKGDVTGAAWTTQTLAADTSRWP